ncbi:hypothetical protein G6F31_016576 [Rhizopus arrhizus]|nr:hypothetical protein G6F31_016576 [Rhizopus arrhizus]
MRSLKLSLFNATGMPKQSINPILQLSQNSDLLFLTETWLLPPTKYRSSWVEYHTYGIPRDSSNIGQLGLALLVNPQCNLPVYQITHTHPLLAKYSLSIVLASKLLIHCLYLPPSLENNEVTTILDALPMQYSNTTNTLLCGDFNARLGTFTGDSRIDPRGRIFYNWMCSHNLILWNQRLTHGQPTSYTVQGTSIIDFFLSTEELLSPSLNIRHDLSLTSNHKFMTLSFDVFDDLQEHLPPKRVTWNLGKLKHPKNRDSYRDLCSL